MGSAATWLSWRLGGCPPCHGIPGAVQHLAKGIMSLAKGIMLSCCISQCRKPAASPVSALYRAYGAGSSRGAACLRARLRAALRPGPPVVRRQPGSWWRWHAQAGRQRRPAHTHRQPPCIRAAARYLSTLIVMKNRILNCAGLRYVFNQHNMQLDIGSTTCSPVNILLYHLQGMERRGHHWRTSSPCWRLQGAAARCWPPKRRRQTWPRHLQIQRQLVLSLQPGCWETR